MDVDLGILNQKQWLPIKDKYFTYPNHPSQQNIALWNHLSIVTLDDKRFLGLESLRITGESRNGVWFHFSFLLFSLKTKGKWYFLHFSNNIFIWFQFRFVSIPTWIRSSYANAWKWFFLNAFNTQRKNVSKISFLFKSLLFDVEQIIHHKFQLFFSLSLSFRRFDTISRRLCKFTSNAWMERGASIESTLSFRSICRFRRCR